MSLNPLPIEQAFAARQPLPIEQAFAQAASTPAPASTIPPATTGSTPAGPGFLTRNINRIPGFSDFTTERFRLGQTPRTARLTPRFLKSPTPAPQGAGFFRQGLANPRLLGGLTRGVGGAILGETAAPIAEQLTPGEGIGDRIAGGATRGGAFGLTLGGPKGAALGALVGGGLGAASPALENVPVVGPFLQGFAGEEAVAEEGPTPTEAETDLEARRAREMLELQLAAAQFIQPMIEDLQQSASTEAQLLRQLGSQLPSGFSQLAQAEAAGRETYADRAAAAYAQQINLMPAFHSMQQQAQGANIGALADVVGQAQTEG